MSKMTKYVKQQPQQQQQALKLASAYCIKKLRKMRFLRNFLFQTKISSRMVKPTRFCHKKTTTQIHIHTDMCVCVDVCMYVVYRLRPCVCINIKHYSTHTTHCHTHTHTLDTLSLILVEMALRKIQPAKQCIVFVCSFACFLAFYCVHGMGLIRWVENFPSFILSFLNTL